MAVTLHTDYGDIKLELFCEQCPKSCENFLALCASDYYNGCVFHRNIKGFMLQTGDPTGTGKGGNSIWGDKFEDELSDTLKHNVRGVVSMANNGPDSNGSQFFITYAKQPHLDLKYTIFGKVIDGFETLDEIEKQPVNEKNYRPLNDMHLLNVTIHANPLALWQIAWNTGFWFRVTMNFECTRADQLVDNLLKIKVMTVTEMPNGTTTLSRQCYLNGYSWK